MYEYRKYKFIYMLQAQIFMCVAVAVFPTFSHHAAHVENGMCYKCIAAIGIQNLLECRDRHVHVSRF